MANIKICDKCGTVINREKFEDAPDIHSQIRDITGEYALMQKDLCDDCMAKYQKVMLDFFNGLNATKIDG